MRPQGCAVRILSSLLCLALGACDPIGGTGSGEPPCDLTKPVPDSVAVGNVRMRATTSCGMLVDGMGERNVSCGSSLYFFDTTTGSQALKSFARSGIVVSIDGRVEPVGEGSFFGVNLDAGQCGDYAWPSRIEFGAPPSDTSFGLSLLQGPERREWPVSFLYDTAAIPLTAIESTDSTLSIRIDLAPTESLSSLVLITRRGDIDMLPLYRASDAGLFLLRFAEATPMRQTTDSANLARESFRLQGRTEGTMARAIVAQDTTAGTFGWSVELPPVALQDVISYRKRFCTNCR